MSLKTIFLALFCSLFLWGCSNKEGALFAVTNNGSLTIEPATTSIHKGTTQAFRAFMIDQDGVRSEVTHEAQWVSSNTSVASIDDSGLATALSAGQTQIKASFSSLEAQADLQVFEQAIQSISVSPAESLSLVGLQNQFTATAVFADGSQQDVTDFSTWSSANPAIATIGSDGMSTAVAPGATDIIASFNNASGTAILAVSESAPKTLLLQANPLTLPLGSSDNMQALLVLENNDQIDVTEQVNWAIVDDSIATVDNNSGNKGFIESKKLGTTTVNANLTFAGATFVANALVKVKSANGLILTLIPTNVTLAKGASYQFRLFASFGDSSTFEVTNDAQWLVEDTNIASIGYTGDLGGLATGLNKGTTDIQASFGGKDITAELIVSDAVITHIQITPSRLSLAKGTSEQLSAKAFYSDGSSIDISALSSWVSASPAILHIETGTANAGLATGVSEGLTQIRASYLGFNSTIPVTVTSSVIKDLQITPQNAEVANGLNINFQARAIYSDGTAIDVTLDAAWASLDPTIVSIISGGADSGLATALAVNHTRITATFDGITSSTAVTVNNASVVSLAIEPTNITSAAGITTQYSAFATLSNGQYIDVSRQAFWTSSKTDVADVTATGTQAGLATALTSGTTDITASFSGQLASTQLTVTDATVIQLMVAPLNTEIIVSTTAQYSATAILSDGSRHDVTTLVSWTTENHSIAQIDSLGLATGISKGASAIKASYIDGSINLSAEAILTVTGPEKPLLFIDLNPVSAAVLINSTQQYTATAVFEDGSKQDVTDDVHWSSTDQRLAIISATGLAVGVSTGVTKIRASATYFGISYSSQTQLTVEAPTAVITAIQVLPNDTAILIGASQSYIALAVLNSGVKIDVTDQVIWSSSDDTIASIDSNAIAQGLSDGAITISADLNYAGNDYHGETQLTVLAPSITIDKIVLEPFNSRIIESDTLSYKATAYLSDNSQVDVSGDVSWQSSHPEFAIVDTNGQATGLAEGSSDISAALLYQGTSYNSERAALTIVAATTVNDIVVTPRNKHIQIQDTLQFTAYALLSDSSIVEIHNGNGVSLIWSADANLVQIDVDGLALGLATGISPITASVTYKGKTYNNTSELTVETPPPTIDEIQITPQITSLLIGTTQAYRATAILSDGSKLDITDESSWSSSNDAIAGIDSSAIATAVSEGTVLITADIVYDTVTYSATADLTVLPLAVTLKKIVVEPFAIQLLEGHTQQYKAIAYLSDGSSQDITGHVSWLSSFPSIASVDINTGLATAIAANVTATEITATINYNGTDYGSERAALTVIAPASIQGIVISPRNANILATTTQQYAAYAILTDFSQIDITNAVSWNSSAAQFATIDNTGLATGISAGNATISADYSAGASFSDSTLLTVEAATVTIKSMKVTPPTATALINGYQQYRADVTLSNGKSVDVTSNVTWTVSQQAIASITQLGLAKGLAVGTTQINATLIAQGDTHGASAIFNVVAPTIDEIKIAPHKAMILKGDEQQYIATALLSDGTKVDITQTVNWSSSNTASVSINDKGIATGTDVGLSDISALLTYDGSDYNSNIAKLTVINAIDHIQITPNAPTIVEGTTQQFTATAILTDFSQLDITELVYWQVVDADTASIEQTGLATGLQVGSTDIIIDFSYQGTSYTDTDILYVQAAPAVDDFYITPGTNNILVGELHQLTATLVFNNGTTQDVTVEASWVSDDNTIAPMQNNEGLVFGLAEGSTHINASIL
ncbi:MAG: Ig-like domain-containing protein, partial [Pseudomonadales bacterium]|nr:Ig-like domain-containing protein [Pseudomonadales bacterium]